MTQPNDLPPVLVSEDRTRHEEWPNDWTPSPPPDDLRVAGEAMTFADCDEMLACIAAILGRHRLNGETHAEMIRWKLSSLTRLQGENARLQDENARLSADNEYMLGEETSLKLDKDAAEAALSALRSAVKQVEQEMRGTAAFHVKTGAEIPEVIVTKWADTLAVIVTQEEEENKKA